MDLTLTVDEVFSSKMIQNENMKNHFLALITTGAVITGCNTENKKIAMNYDVESKTTIEKSLIEDRTEASLESTTTAYNNAIENRTETSSIDYQTEPSLVKKIAMANGYENWKNIEELRFTFNVDRGENPHFERSWVWKTKTNEVTMMTAEDTVSYDRKVKELDSTASKANSSFINDKYWLLAPINILWDESNITTEHTQETKAPLSKEPMQKLSVVYGSEGGYTPGDAYDFYFGDDLVVKEWVFRKGNQDDPSMITTWEDYEEVGGLKIAKMHKDESGDFKLYFTDVAAE